MSAFSCWQFVTNKQPDKTGEHGIGPERRERRSALTAQSLRWIAARLPPVLDEEVLRVAREIEENATRLKETG
jgi:hypothetical protein